MMKKFDLTSVAYIGDWMDDKRVPSQYELRATLDAVVNSPDDFDFSITDVLDALSYLTGQDCRTL